ncbi:MAG: gluconate 2-dehydrogenase subunit 3 family protein [Sphingobacteriales bacterium]|nr:MAG: gluconate 2-dehydrogenase subunit 3 family protein [Sphingobacteriales bacterium]
MHTTLLATDVLDWLSQLSLTPVTREALEARLEKEQDYNRFFPDDAFLTLSLVCDRLLAQEEMRLVNIAIFIDDRLFHDKGKGWRYSELPPDAELYRLGIQGIDQTALIRLGAPFRGLSTTQQDEVLHRIQAGNPEGEIWKTLSAKRFFEELLTEATEIFVSHPRVQMQMGYTGMGDANGWQSIGLPGTFPTPQPIPEA